jgi:hypothetical protein
MYKLVAARKVGPSIADLTDKEISDARKCWACSKAEDPSQVGGKLLVCKRCRTAYYCSKECQRAAWKEHKASCEPYVEFPAFSKDRGRSLDVRSVGRSLDLDADEGNEFERHLTRIECGAAQGDQDALAAKADVLLALRDFAGAAAILIPLAEAGHPRAQWQVCHAESKIFLCGPLHWLQNVHFIPTPHSLSQL